VDRSVPAGQSAPEHSGTASNGTGSNGTGGAGNETGPTAGQPAHAAPAEDTGTMEKDWRPQVYKVRAGDTLYGIAFNFGLDYHELAEINNIPDPAVIHPDQELRLFPAAGSAEAVSAVAIKEQPLAIKLPYSEQAVAQIEKGQAVQPVTGTKIAETKPGTDTKPGMKPGTRSGNPQGEVVVTAGIAPGGVPVHWEMPTSGRVVAGFSEADNRKGVDIAGKLGQPIYASAPGKVIFCGSGLRGYGKLVIIKHDATYLSAYAHNDKLLVKEGQIVSKGQMIAQMGKTDAERVALHFEIRKLGKPVDPAKYLVFPKS
jgi:lipoprotein NlpD